MISNTLNQFYIFQKINIINLATAINIFISKYSSPVPRFGVCCLSLVSHNIFYSLEYVAQSH